MMDPLLIWCGGKTPRAFAYFSLKAVRQKIWSILLSALLIDLRNLLSFAMTCPLSSEKAANGSSALADLSSPHLVIRSTGSVAYNVPDFFIGRTIILLEYILSKLVLYLHWICVNMHIQCFWYILSFSLPHFNPSVERVTCFFLKLQISLSFQSLEKKSQIPYPLYRWSPAEYAGV